MNYTAVIKQTPSCIVYSKRFIAPDFDSYPQLILAIGEDVRTANPQLKCSDISYCFIAYHDKDFKDKNVDVEYCEAVQEFGKEGSGIVFKKIPSITVASIMHKGPYAGLKDAYISAMKWAEDNGYTIPEPIREQYIDGCWNKPNPEDWLTEIQVPIVKK